MGCYFTTRAVFRSLLIYWLSTVSDPELQKQITKNISVNSILSTVIDKLSKYQQH